MDDLETIINKWEGWGLLEDLSITQKPIAAMLYERTAQHIVGLDLTLPSNGEKRAETIIFPCIYRVVKRNCRIDGVVPFYNELVQFLNVNETQITELESSSYYAIDAEAEFTALFCEEYMERKTDPIKPSKTIPRWVK